MVRDVYPSEFATTRQYPNSDGEHQGAAEDAENAAVKCAQCGAPIEDADNLAACWNCSSDNFLGQIYSP
jgi:Zn finger protein HypA/HybF involved in hydrogenase expression